MAVQRPIERYRLTDQLVCRRSNERGEGQSEQVIYDPEEETLTVTFSDIQIVESNEGKPGLDGGNKIAEDLYR